MPITWKRINNKKQNYETCLRSLETLLIQLSKIDCYDRESLWDVKKFYRSDSYSVAIASILNVPPVDALLPLINTGDGKVPFSKSILSCRSLLFSIYFKQPSKATFLCIPLPMNSSSTVISEEETNTPETGIVSLKSINNMSPTLIWCSDIWNLYPSLITVTCAGFFPKLSLLIIAKDRHLSPIFKLSDRIIKTRIKMAPVLRSEHFHIYPHVI